MKKLTKSVVGVEMSPTKRVILKRKRRSTESTSDDNAMPEHALVGEELIEGLGPGECIQCGNYTSFCCKHCRRNLLNFYYCDEKCRLLHLNIHKNVCQRQISRFSQLTVQSRNCSEFFCSSNKILQSIGFE